MRNLALQTLADQLAADKTISADEALELRKAVFPDGVVSREEAEMLIALAARVANSDEAWSHAFVEAITDHVLAQGEYPGHVDEATVSWLTTRLGKEGPRETEIEAVLKILERAESTPDYLSGFARERLTAHVKGAPIGRSETEMVRRCLYASAGAGRTSVIEDEARWMFALDAESDGRANDAAWGDLFVKAILNHLMACKAPALLEANAMMARQAWLAKETPGVGGIFGAMFQKGWQWTARTPNEVDGWEGHYAEANAAAEEDARLTLSEIAWTVGMTKEDGKRTANEAKLLEEIRNIEASQATVG